MIKFNLCILYNRILWIIDYNVLYVDNIIKMIVINKLYYCIGIFFCIFYFIYNKRLLF